MVTSFHSVIIKSMENTIESIRNILDISVGDFTLGKILSAVITLAICILATKIIIGLLKKIMRKSSVKKETENSVIKVVNVILKIVTVVVVATAAGINTTSFVAILSVASLGITLAMNDILSDIAGGIVMVATQPFAVGDYISTDRFDGTVSEIHLTNSKLKAPDGQLITVPNHVLASSIVTDYTRSGKRRIVIYVGACYSSPTEAVRKACLEAMNSCDKILDDPAPQVFLNEYRDSDIQYRCQCWVNACDFFSSKMYINEKIRETFKENGVEMAYPHLDLNIISKEN